MMILNKLDSALGFHQDALRIRAQRQELIAANIANADTPHYKARDIDFKATMQQAAKQVAGGGLSTVKTSALHFNGIATQNPNSAGPGEPLFRPIIQGSLDGNTVDMDVERNTFADNAIRYEASLLMINGQIKKMLTAIQGQ
jgi:flagellar basal-body rod protein FlgB